MSSIRKGDTVEIIAGKDKGVTGKVLDISRKDSRVVVEGANRVKRHTKEDTTERGVKVGGIVTVEAPIHLSNVMLQFDGNGNYTFGLTEQVVFPEIEQDKLDRTRGMDITFVTTAKTDEEGRELLKALGFPFKEA